jgi:hypothetical protein
VTVKKGGFEERSTKKYIEEELLKSEESTLLYRRDVYIRSVIG